VVGAAVHEPEDREKGPGLHPGVKTGPSARPMARTIWFRPDYSSGRGGRNIQNHIFIANHGSESGRFDYNQERKLLAGFRRASRAAGEFSRDVCGVPLENNVENRETGSRVSSPSHC